MSIERPVWKKEYELEIELIDKEHQQMFAILNRIMDLPDVLSQRDNLFEVLHSLIEYVQVHFRDEEALMVAIEVPNLERVEHTLMHNRFIEGLFHLEAHLKRDPVNPKERFVNFVSEWFHLHTTKYDRKLVPYIQAYKKKNFTGDKYGNTAG